MPKQPYELLDEYLSRAKLMQLATMDGKKPWICTVYFVWLHRTLYWLSWPERRHSQQLAQHPYVAAAIAVKADKPVIGVQMAGNAGVVTDATVIEQVMAIYSHKYDGAGAQFANKFAAGTNHHQMYYLTPEEVSLFDELQFPENGRQILEVYNKNI